MTDIPGTQTRPGPLNALTDVPGLRVGHAQRVGDGALTGTTVVLGPPAGMTAAVDVRGGAPGTRETDALDPGALVPRIDAVVLTGGSAYGLEAATGVAAWLEEQGRGFPVGAAPHEIVPVVPAAVLFDLGRGGDFRARPDAALGRAAVAAADGSPDGAPVAQGGVGAGTGAVAGRIKGGVGTASVLLDGGVVVAALIVVNASGSLLDPVSGLPYAASLGLDGEFGLRSPAPGEHAAAQAELARLDAARRAAVPLNTTLAVVATNAELTRPAARRFAGVAHGGLARAIRPVHTLFDGDIVFGLATGEIPLAGGSQAGAWATNANAVAVNAVLSAGADALARAAVHALLAAEPVTTPRGHVPSYRELYPTATADSVHSTTT